METKIINGEQHHIYSLNFDNIGNNSVRVNYKLIADPLAANKFTQFEFNILAELDQTSQAHSQFMVDNTQDKVTTSPTFGIYRDRYLKTGLDTTASHWGDDWSHDNINFMAMKNYLDPKASELRSIENYLIDFMWKNYMKYTQSTFTVANYLMLQVLTQLQLHLMYGHFLKRWKRLPSSICIGSKRHIRI